MILELKKLKIHFSRIPNRVREKKTKNFKHIFKPISRSWDIERICAEGCSYT
jgi:hypothetical protein